MGLLRYIGNKVLSLVLFVIALVSALSFKSAIGGWIALITGLAGIYFWKHSPF